VVVQHDVLQGNAERLGADLREDGLETLAELDARDGDVEIA
jgi:hypothetical protein